MAEANGARKWLAIRALEARRVGAQHMEEANGARSRDATRALEARRVGAYHMGGASAVTRKVAAQALEARGHFQAAAYGTEVESGVRRGAARAPSPAAMESVGFVRTQGTQTTRRKKPSRASSTLPFMPEMRGQRLQFSYPRCTRRNKRNTFSSVSISMSSTAGVTHSRSLL